MDDPCAPIRQRIQRIDEELSRREQNQAGGGSPQILTPGDVGSDLAGKTVRQLRADRQEALRQLAECEAQH